MSANTSLLTYTTTERSRSPEFSDTLANHVFITNVFQSNNHSISSPIPSNRTHESSSSSYEPTMRKSLEEISKDIKEIDDFLTVTEDVMRKERERDRELYARERQRKASETDGHHSNKENKSPESLITRRYSLKSPTFKINKMKFHRRNKSATTKKSFKSLAYFSNGRIGCSNEMAESSPNIIPSDGNSDSFEYDIMSPKCKIKLVGDDVDDEEDELKAIYGFTGEQHEYSDDATDSNVFCENKQNENGDCLEMVIVNNIIDLPAIDYRANMPGSASSCQSNVTYVLD